MADRIKRQGKSNDIHNSNKHRGLQKQNNEIIIDKVIGEPDKIDTKEKLESMIERGRERRAKYFQMEYDIDSQSQKRHGRNSIVSFIATILSISIIAFADYAGFINLKNWGFFERLITLIPAVLLLLSGILLYHYLSAPKNQKKLIKSQVCMDREEIVWQDAVNRNEDELANEIGKNMSSNTTDGSNNRGNLKIVIIEKLSFIIRKLKPF